MSASHLFLKSGYPGAPLANGVGRYVKQLQRITIKFCKSHGCSRGVREFIEHDLVNFAKDNPGVVVYAKPRRHRTPVLSAEYLNGEKKWMSIRNYSREEVYKWIHLLTTQSGLEEVRLKNYQFTHMPSIQGVWTPFFHRNPALNVATFPNKELSQPANLAPSATELLLELYKKQKENEKARETLDGTIDQRGNEEANEQLKKSTQKEKIKAASSS